MHKTGHWGTALLLYAPVGAALLLAGWEGIAVLGGFGMVALSRVPDLDKPLPFVTHRGWTHTLAFGVVVGLVTGVATLAVATTQIPERALALGALGFGIGFYAILSHLLADVITPMGITPFWPFSSAHYTLDVMRADNRVGNFTLLVLGVSVTVVVLAAFGAR